MRAAYLAIMILMFSSCNNTVLKLKAAQHSFIEIDNNKYDYYIREFYTAADASGYKIKSKQDIQVTDHAKLIEVEYLFISKDDRNHVIYMTTVPDRRQNRYSDHYLGNDSVNMFDVRMLHFGRLMGNRKDSFYFSDFKIGERDIWKIDRLSGVQQLVVSAVFEEKREELNQVLIPGASLESPVIFEKVNGFALVYHNHFKKSLPVASVDQNRIFYQPGDPGEIYLFYTFPEEAESHVLRFKGKQIVYDPKNIFR